MMIKSAAGAFSVALLALSLAACASKTKPTASLPPAPATPPPAAVEPQPAIVRPSAQVVPGSQEDLVQSAGDRIYFAVDSFELDAEATGTLERQARWLASHGAVRVRIEGNADERGTREYNFALGARRAEAVRRFLMQNGVETGRVETVSFGK